MINWVGLCYDGIMKNETEVTISITIDQVKYLLLVLNKVWELDIVECIEDNQTDLANDLSEKLAKLLVVE